MNYESLTKKDTYTLEGMIDAHGLFAVLDAVSEICSGKAEHIEINWQDKPLARGWKKAGRSIATIASKMVRARSMPTTAIRRWQTRRRGGAWHVYINTNTTSAAE